MKAGGLLWVGGFFCGIAAGILISFFLFAGDDSDDPTAIVTPTPTLIPPVFATPFPENARAGIASAPVIHHDLCATAYGYSDTELEFLVLLNAYRAKNNLHPLQKDWRLSKSANWKLNDEVTFQYMAHDDLPIDRTWTERFRDCTVDLGYAWGENLVGNTFSAAAALDSWQHSPGHNALLLSSTYYAIGVGFTVGTDLTLEFKGMWAADFSAMQPVWFRCADLDGSGRIAIQDIRLVQQLYGTGNVLADLDENGAVGASDIAGAVKQYFTYCQQDPL